jgi:DeoR family lactose phosphotransferase system repressor
MIECCSYIINGKASRDAGNSRFCGSPKIPDDEITLFAASMIVSGDYLFLDSSDLSLRLAEVLAGCSADKITIVTNSFRMLELSRILSSRPNFILTGGDLTSRNGSLSGPLAEKMLKSLRFTKSFVSGCGFSGGMVFSENPSSAKIAKRTLRQSSEKYCMIESFKHGKKSSWELEDICGFKLLITDSGFKERPHAPGERFKNLVIA